MNRKDISHLWNRVDHCPHDHHEWHHRVTAGSPEGGPYWSAWVCHRGKCNRKAHTKAYLFTGLETREEGGRDT